MLSIRDVEAGAKINFEVYPSAILGNDFKNVELTAVFTADIAMAIGTDIFALHANVYPSLPTGTPNNPLEYNWIQVRYDNGQKVTIGVPWIKAGTLEVINAGNYSLTFNNRTQQQIDQVMLALSAIGITPDSVNRL